MSTPLQHVMALIPTVVPEERRGRPGAAREAALAAAAGNPAERPWYQLLAVYASFAAGEPREALRLLDTIQQSNEALVRRVAACQAWAQALELNWYPGDIGGEISSTNRPGVFKARADVAQDPDTRLLEACAALGPATVLSSRSVVSTMRLQAARPADAVAGGAMQSLGTFADTAAQIGANTSALWARAAAADIARRTGRLIEARAALKDIRKDHEALQDVLGTAMSWMLEGDWLATPGASPEALGIRLEDESPPSFEDQRDDAAAAQAYENARVRLERVDAPRARAAVALRLALLASRGGDTASQEQQLVAAQSAFAEAGDAAGVHLATVHRWIAGLARGDLAAVRSAAPLEWGPLHGPVLEISQWGETRGSPSYCAGLGRLLQRHGQRWAVAGEHDRAEIALRLARGLISMNGAVPTWTIPEALASLDDKRGFQTRSVVRRLQILDRQPPPIAPAKDAYAWLQDLYLTSTLINVPTGIIGAGPIAIQLLRRGDERMRAIIDLAVPGAAAAPAPAGGGPPEARDVTTPAGVTDYLRELSSGKQTDAEKQLIAAGVVAAQQTRERAEPLAAMTRARMNERMGWDTEAEHWFRAAVQASRAGSDVGWIEVLALNAWGKADEALSAFQALARAPNVREDLLAALALRARDFDRARMLFARLPLPAPGAAGSTWRDLADRAEAQIEGGDPRTALTFAQRAIEDLEAMLAGLTRNSDRLEVCDDISMASLYQYAARARLALAAVAEDRGDVKEAAAQRREAFAIADRQRTLALPAELSAADSADDLLRRWQQATTEYVTAYQRLLAALMAGGDKEGSATHTLSSAERELAAIEAMLEGQGLLAPRRDAHLSPDKVCDLQALLPPRTVLLEYLLVGRDFLGFAMTSKQIDGCALRLSKGVEGRVSRLLRACEGGGSADVEEAELGQILLQPFKAMLRDARRVIIVPSGSLSALPFHLLPFEGAALCATRVVSYLPAAAMLLGGGLDRPLAAGESLVIGDPAFDQDSHPGLRRLAGAGIEARRVAELYQTDAIFEAEKAIETELRPKLPGRSLLHFAAHGRLDDIAPYTSSIVLAGRDELTVSDFIGLQIDADLAVLSACDTGRGTTTLGGDVIGLTRGLLAAGVKRCVVSLWPVDDVAACITMTAFHARLKQRNVGPAQALADAQQEIRALSGAEIAERYRALGGKLGAGERSMRRGGTGVTRQLLAYPEQDQEDEVSVEDAPGSSAKLWAPFVLIGC